MQLGTSLFRRHIWIPWLINWLIGSLVVTLLTLSVELADDRVDERVLRRNVSSTDRHRGPVSFSRPPGLPDDDDRRRQSTSTSVRSALVGVVMSSLNARRFHHMSSHPGRVQSDAANVSNSERGASAAASSATTSSAGAAEAIERRQRTARLQRLAAGWQYAAPRRTLTVPFARNVPSTSRHCQACQPPTCNQQSMRQQ